MRLDCQVCIAIASTHGTALCRAPVSSVTAHRRSATMAPTLSNLIPSPALHQRAADTMSSNDEQLQAY